MVLSRLTLFGHIKFRPAPRRHEINLHRIGRSEVIREGLIAQATSVIKRVTLSKTCHAPAKSDVSDFARLIAAEVGQGRLRVKAGHPVTLGESGGYWIARFRGR
jgi:hypothetical protein